MQVGEVLVRLGERVLEGRVGNGGRAAVRLHFPHLRRHLGVHGEGVQRQLGALLVQHLPRSQCGRATGRQHLHGPQRLVLVRRQHHFVRNALHA